jgi:hypothetical protein
MCDRMAPCRTLAFARGHVSNTRYVIKLLSGSLDIGSGVTFNEELLVIDGTNTTISPSGATAFTISGNVTLEGVKISSLATTRTFVVQDGGVLRAFDVQLTNGNIENSGQLLLGSSDVVGQQMACLETGLMSVDGSIIRESQISASACQLTITQSRFESGPDGIPMLDAIGGKITIENTIFVENDEFSNLVSIAQASPGSAIRFSNLIHSSLSDREVPLISCSGVELTSNIIATNSSTPLSQTCIANNSLFDSAATGLSGVANVTADVTTFFVDRENGDFHLTLNSPARELGVAGLVEVDLEGNARPAPNGTAPDVGAYEAL